MDTTLDPWEILQTITHLGYCGVPAAWGKTRAVRLNLVRRDLGVGNSEANISAELLRTNLEPEAI
jgi:hypothetical protein